MVLGQGEDGAGIAVSSQSASLGALFTRWPSSASAALPSAAFQKLLADGLSDGEVGGRQMVLTVAANPG